MRSAILVILIIVLGACTIVEDPPDLFEPPLPSPWQSTDIGNPTMVGNASYEQGTFTIRAGGSDIWGTSDEFHYVYQPISGNATLTARIEGIEHTHNSAKAALMIRESLNAESRHAHLRTNPPEGHSLVGFQVRAQTGGETENRERISGYSLPLYIRLIRSSDMIRGYYSEDAETWHHIDTFTFSLPENVYIGLAVTSRNPDEKTTARFTNIHLEHSAPDELPPGHPPLIPPDDPDEIVLEPGTFAIDLSTCVSSTAGAPERDGIRASPAIGSNTVVPVGNSPDGRYTYGGWIDENHNAMIAAYDHHTDTCGPITQLNEMARESVSGSHDAVGIGVDGLGYIYASYFGNTMYRKDGQEHGGTSRRWGAGPYRQSVHPDDISEFGEKLRLRDWTVNERQKFRMRDGALLVAGADLAGLIDIIEPGGEFRWPGSRQVVQQDEGEKPPYVCRANRFTKTQFYEGPDGTLYALWGWGHGGRDDCDDIRRYSEDSHEVFFAYSTDGGITWHNREGTRNVESKLCLEYSDCNRYGSVIADGGIVHDDPDFILTPTRQREHRVMWAEPNGDIYVTFTKSTWCDEGICLERDVTDPGALMLVRFNLNRPEDGITETIVNNDPDRSHFRVAGIRKADDALYIWVTTRSPSRFFEYVSYDDGETWSSTQPINGSCGRIGGDYFVPHQNVANFILECRVDSTRGAWIYQRRFDG